ncbi:hypothetical protein ACROYT_G001320 [Oculina patagonica]
MEPLRRLTQKGVEWFWGNAEDKAFNEVKQLVTQAPILVYYSPDKELVIQCDASSLGIGAALMQEGRPLAYASRALTDPETRYATIEKEMLAIVFALEKWHHFVFGRRVIIRSDHKPFEAITKKPLDRAPKRLQGMLLRSLAYDIEVQYSPGHTQHLADMTSRSYLPADGQGTCNEFKAVNAVQFLPIGQGKLQKFRVETEQDDTLQALKTTILKGWPEDKSNVPSQLAPYYSMRDELSIYDGLVFKGERLVVPKGLRAEVKKDIHASHAGVEGCLRRARESVYWPGMNSEFRHWISTCEPCRLFEIPHGKETLLSHEVPKRPWEKAAVDLFSLNQTDYLLCLDYYSGYWELDKLHRADAETVVKKLKAHFARHGSPCQLVSDNGAQFTAAEFKRMTKTCDIEHSVTSPYNSKANGKVEAAVKSAKRLLRKTAKAGDDFYLGLLLNATPHHKEWKKGVVVEMLDERSYEVETGDGTSYRRNRVHLKRTNELPPKGTTNLPPQVSNTPDTTGGSTCQGESSNTLDTGTSRVELNREIAESDCGVTTRTRSGRIVKRPSYLADYNT